MKEWQRDNRAWWDERAPSHAASDFYDLEGFQQGQDRLRPYELGEIGRDVDGIDLVHLQCHIGTDTLSWARHGARVVGVDFSGPAIETAQQLALDSGLADRAEFVVADVFEAADAVRQRKFDVVYTGIGALSWLPDIDRWAQVVRSLLRRRGVVYVVEIHPFQWVFDDDNDEPAVMWDYFAEVHWTDSTGSYTDRALPTKHNRTHERNWGIGPVVSALANAGLAIELVHEHPIGVERYWPWMEQVPGRRDLWRIPADRPALPLTWSLRARRVG